MVARYYESDMVISILVKCICFIVSRIGKTYFLIWVTLNCNNMYFYVNKYTQSLFLVLGVVEWQSDHIIYLCSWHRLLWARSGNKMYKWCWICVLTIFAVGTTIMHWTVGIWWSSQQACGQTHIPLGFSRIRQPVLL